MCTHFVYTVPHISRLTFLKGNSISSPLRGTVYAHFVYTVPHISKVCFFRGNSISSPVRGTVYTHLVYTVLIHLEWLFLIKFHI